LEVEAICEASIERGLGETAIADYAEFPALDGCLGYLRPGKCLAPVRLCRRKFGRELTIRTLSRLRSRTGTRTPSTLLSTNSYDVVLGSLYYVDDLPGFSRRCLGRPTLKEGGQSRFGELADLAAGGEFDVLGHFDIICRAAYRAFGEAIHDYRS
jgi:hypothetical protein